VLEMVKRVLPLLVAAGALVALWELLRAAGVLAPALAPTFGAVVDASFDLLRDGEFLLDVWQTARRTLVGLAVGLLGGVPLGALMGMSRNVARGAGPLVDFFRALPAVALLPALATLFGIGEFTKTLLIAIPSGLLVATFSYFACREVSPELIETLELRGLSRGEVVRAVFVPAILYRLPSGVRYALPLALALAVVADMFVGARHGLGLRLIAYQETFQLAHLYGTIMIAGVLGAAMYALSFVVIPRRLRTQQNGGALW